MKLITALQWETVDQPMVNDPVPRAITHQVNHQVNWPCYIQVTIDVTLFV